MMCSTRSRQETGPHASDMPLSPLALTVPRPAKVGGAPLVTAVAARNK
jgi:hypothetical protein